MQEESPNLWSWIPPKKAELQVAHHCTASQDLALVLSMREFSWNATTRYTTGYEPLVHRAVCHFLARQEHGRVRER